MTVDTPLHVPSSRPRRLAACALWLACALPFLARPVPAADLRLVTPTPTGLAGASVTLVPDGRILVYGGGYGTIWNPVARKWEPVASDPVRYSHTATLTADGRVLLLGGVAVEDARYGQQAALSSNTTWVVGANRWESGPGLLEPRVGHTATALPGNLVLVVGGSVSMDHGKPVLPMLASAELVGDRSTRRAGSLHDARAGHSASLLADGRVLVAGGIGSDGEPLRSVELFDPATGAWTSGPPLAWPRSAHAATVLADGSVLVSGGLDAGGRPLRSTELWLPGAARWVDGGDLAQARARHEATRLADGSVLVSGGLGAQERPVLALERRDAASGRWQLAGHAFRQLREHHAIALANGTVLLFGTDSYSADGVLAWLPDEPERQRLDLPPDGVVTALADGRYLLVGGRRRNELSPEASVYERADDRWYSTRPMHWARTDVRALRLPDGRVLVTGAVDNGGRRGQSADEPVPQFPAEIWDPRTGEWRESASLRSPEHSFVELALLPDGRVFAGALDNYYRDSDVLGHYRLWDPASDAVGELRAVDRPRRGGTGLLLANGDILYAGGSSEAPDGGDARDRGTGTDVWNSATGTWRRLADAPASLRGLVLRALGDGTAIAWQPPRGDADSVGVFYLWRGANGWLPLPSPGTLRASDSIEPVALGDGVLMLVVGGRDSWTWRPGAGGWTHVAHDSAWPALLAVPVMAGRDILAFHTLGSESDLAPSVVASVLDREEGRWESATAGYAQRDFPAMSVLPDGHVLVIGGGSAVVQSWDPARNAWRNEPFLPVPLTLPQALDLGDGRLLVAGFDGSERHAIRCALRDRGGGAWQDCGRVAVDAGETWQPMWLRRLGEGQALLVYGKQRAMLWEAGSGWTATRLRMPHDLSLPPASSEGKAYLSDIVDAWNPRSGRWEDASDVLFANALGLPVARDAGEGLLVLAGPSQLLHWDPSSKLLRSLSLQPTPMDRELDALVHTQAGCFAAWNNSGRPGYQAMSGAAAPGLYAGELAGRAWRPATGVALDPMHAGAVLLGDGTLLLAGRNRDGAPAAHGTQRLHVDCLSVAAIGDQGAIYLPVAAAGAAPVIASASVPLSAAGAAPAAAPLPQRWLAQAGDTLYRLRGAPVRRFIAGVLLLLLARRAAARWAVYPPDEDAGRAAQRIDVGCALLAAVLLALASGCPWPAWQALIALCAGIALFITLWRLHSNAASPRARIAWALPYLVGALAGALGAGSALTGVFGHWFQQLTE